MNSFQTGLLIAAVVATPFATAVAQDGDEPDYARVGYYIVGGAAVAFENSDDLDEAEDLAQLVLDFLIEDAIDDGDLPVGTEGDAELKIEVMPGFHLAGGYRLSPRFAFEGEFEWAKGDLKLKQTLTAPGFESTSATTKLAEYSYLLFGINTKVFALTGRIQPYVMAGVAFMHQELKYKNLPDDDATGAGFRLGGGADLYFTENAAFRADFGYILTAGNLKDNDVMSLNVGVLWRF
jgi:opacity protein-like surface antigen